MERVTTISTKDKVSNNQVLPDPESHLANPLAQNTIGKKVVTDSKEPQLEELENMS